MTLVMFSLGATLAVLVTGSASAAPSKGKKTTSTAASSKGTKRTSTTTETTPMMTTTTTSPGDTFFVINGTVNAASDHEIIGSSAFPNFTTGAVDNYYSMAHSHVDNSPFAEGTASPADTGPIGQTAAAGNTQQPQYADARWPGSPDKATYGNQGGPYAAAEAGEYRATAEASEATNGLSGPGLGGSKTLALPKGFDLGLRQALAGWKAKWQGPLGLKKPTTPPTPAVTTPIATVTVPTAGVTTPTATVTTPIATVTTPTPHPAVAGVSPTPPVTVPTTLPSAGATAKPRSLAARPLASRSPASVSAPADGEALLASSTSATLVPAIRTAKTDTSKIDTTKTSTTQAHTTKTKKTKTKKTKTNKTSKPKTTKAKTPKADRSKTYALVTSGESSLGRVTLGGGQIVIEGIHVTASITNDGTPTYKAAVSVASASIGGVPVTIDQDGVHVAGQGQGVPYQQAGDALNAALKHAGIQLFLVAPEVTTNSCDQTGTGTGTGTTTTMNSSDQSGTSTAPNSCDQTGATAMCGQTGTGTGTTPATPTPPTPLSPPSGTTTMPSSCEQTCDQTGMGTGAGTGTGMTTTATTTSRAQSRPTTTTTSRAQSDTTTTASSCGGNFATTPTGSCGQAGTAAGTTTTSNDQSYTTTTMSSSDQMGLGTGMTNSGAETVTATGVHVVFTQPVNQPGVPAQYVEHILGEVFVDSLAVPAPPAPNLDLSSSSSFSSACLGHSRGTTSGGGLTSGGSASAAGSGSSSSLSPSASGFGSASQPSSTGNSLPAAFAAALRKPLWLLLAYVLWQAIVIATGVSLWNWRRGGAS
jgi:hypothetical protein